MKNLQIRASYMLCAIMFSCVKNPAFENIAGDCATLQANTTFEELTSLYQGETIQIQEDLIVEGYVISSDGASNFFNVIYLQDNPINPTQGIQLEIEQSYSNLYYPVGSKLMVRLKGLYLGHSGDAFKVGGSFTSFGNISVGRLPTLKAKEHLLLGCEDMQKVTPQMAGILDLEQVNSNTLVRLENIEFVEEDLGNPYANPKEETTRLLKDCDENEVELLTSGFADFQAKIIPSGRGTITGILKRNGNDFQLLIRDLEDVQFTQDRCPELITEFTSDEIFISELADPDNNSGARFVELYNAGVEPLDLNQWILRRYTNANLEVGSEIDLSGFVLGPKSTLVISPNATEFESVYGFPPDIGVSTNSPADSNGDDNLELVDPFGTIIDAFGVVGEDGSGTNHEFEDGRAARHLDVIKGNPVYTFSEWVLYNDTGEAGTIKQPQNAPNDFTPGNRE